VIRFVRAASSPTEGLDRRQWLRLGVAGLGLAALRAGAAGAGTTPGFGKARSVILLYLSGGQSQIDTWDPKPRAPAEVRGAFRTIATSVPGTHVTEHLPHLARLAHRYAIVRSLSHDDLDHGSASYVALTGQFHPRKSSNPPPRPTDFPTYGAVLHRVHACPRLPFTAVHVNGPALVPELPAPGQNGGFLGRACDPLLVGDVSGDEVPIVGLEEQEGLSAQRLRGRRSLVTQIDDARRRWERQPGLLEMDASFRQAYELLSARQVRRMFDLTEEPAAVRDRYGRHRTGQACLLARRLVEAGVRFVNVHWPNVGGGHNWDTHADGFRRLKNALLPPTDRAVASLIEDLADRGLLARTLVVVMTEFGRAPQIGKTFQNSGGPAGRDHWSSCFSVLLAGGGVKGGQAYGRSDARGAFPAEKPLTPADVVATVYHALGIDPHVTLHDARGQAHVLCDGKPIRDLLK
jgi:hypothetical protein